MVRNSQQRPSKPAKSLEMAGYETARGAQGDVAGGTNLYSFVPQKDCPTAPKRPPPLTKRPAEPLTETEVWKLVGALSSRTSTGLRNRALIIVLWRAGLRISEALALRPSDVDSSAGTLRVLHGKGDKARTASIDRGAFEYLDRWLERRSTLGLPAGATLFCALNGPPVLTSYVRKMMPKWAARAGITKRVHAHGLRHTHAVELRREGVEVGLIAQQLGHSSIATTDRYLNHIAPAEVAKAIHARRMHKPNSPERQR